MSTFEHLIERQPRDLVGKKDDPTILLVKQRRAHRAMKLREGNYGLTPYQAYLEAHSYSLSELGLKQADIDHIEALTPQETGRSSDEIAQIQGRLGLHSEILLP